MRAVFCKNAAPGFVSVGLESKGWLTLLGGENKLTRRISYSSTECRGGDGVVVVVVGQYSTGSTGDLEWSTGGQKHRN